MNIKKTKELEDLKVKNESIQKQISKYVDDAKKQALADAKNSFNSFFKGHGFTVTMQPPATYASEKITILRAVYGNQQIELNVPDAQMAYFGAYSVMNLITSNSAKKAAEYTITVNEYDLKESKRASFGRLTTRLINNLSEDEALQAEIDELEGTIKKSEEKLAAMDDFKLGFRMYDADATKLNPNLKVADTKQYSTFTELLEEQFK